MFVRVNSEITRPNWTKFASIDSARFVEYKILLISTFFKVYLLRPEGIKRAQGVKSENIFLWSNLHEYFITQRMILITAFSKIKNSK